MSMPIRLFSPADSGLRFVFPAAEALPVAEAALAVLEVVLPLGMPEDTTVWPIVGNGALGSTFQPVGVGVGQAGSVNPEAEEAYADEATPVGDRVAH
jgi:hypothetical protein